MAYKKTRRSLKGEEFFSSPLPPRLCGFPRDTPGSPTLQKHACLVGECEFTPLTFNLPLRQVMGGWMFCIGYDSGPYLSGVDSINCHIFLDWKFLWNHI